MTSLGVPTKLRGDVLPTEIQIYNHFLFLIQQKCSTGDWKNNTPLSTKANAVFNDVSVIWDSTAIPNMLKSREGMRKITTLLNKCKTLTKVPLSRRQPGFDNDLQQLFDVSICHHAEDRKCTCEQEHKVGVGGNSYFIMRSSALYEPDSII